MLEKIMSPMIDSTIITPIELDSKILEDGTKIKVSLCSYEVGLSNKKYKVFVLQNDKIIDESNFFITYMKAKEVYKKLLKFYLGV